MKVELLQVTQKLDVIETNQETQEQEIYFSRVEDIGTKSIMIAPPFRRGFYLPPWPGRTITVRVVAEKVPYLFESSLIRYVSDQIPLWEVTKPEQFRKIQMRENVRLDIGLKATLTPLYDEDEGKIIKTVTKDVSAGGGLIVLPRALQVGDKYKVSIALSPEFILEAEGQVVRVLPPNPPQEKYFAGVKFKEKDIDETLKKKILRFIFLKQAEKRQKEKEWFG
jgi:c-di-GMP-binding flagellar brake protein YcgR